MATQRNAAIKVDFLAAADSMRRAQAVARAIADAWRAKSFESTPIYDQLKRECYYEVEWTDEVGNILVCRIHHNNSKHHNNAAFYIPLGWSTVPCLTLDPYKEGINV